MSDDSKEFNRSQLWGMVLGKFDEQKADSRRIFEKLDEINARVSGHMGNEVIHRPPEERPCKFFEEHIKEHGSNKKESNTWVRSLVFWVLGLVSSAFLFIFGAKYGK